MESARVGSVAWYVTGRFYTATDRDDPGPGLLPPPPGPRGAPLRRHTEREDRLLHLPLGPVHEPARHQWRPVPWARCHGRVHPVPQAAPGRVLRYPPLLLRGRAHRTFRRDSVVMGATFTARAPRRDCSRSMSSPPRSSGARSSSSEAPGMISGGCCRTASPNGETRAPRCSPHRRVSRRCARSPGPRSPSGSEPPWVCSLPLLVRGGHTSLADHLRPVTDSVPLIGFVTTGRGQGQ